MSKEQALYTAEAKPAVPPSLFKLAGIFAKSASI